MAHYRPLFAIKNLNANLSRCRPLGSYPGNPPKLRLLSEISVASFAGRAARCGGGLACYAPDA
jgi:hypothetical protein